ncbi:DUF397 domain-containing protein [Streptomyces sp. SID10853]|nr:DUF397 domain-containing protein [Streptomyces sp. SID10853]NDZ82231.1 DUF397 domain-containing protein [Streptomyces sp. SID10853]
MDAAIERQESPFSNGQEQCVEIAEHDGEILMRESDDPSAVTAS